LRTLGIEGCDDCDADVLDDVCAGGVALEWRENIFMMGEGSEVACRGNAVPPKHN
jgi:hypothetical protein